MEGKEGWGVSAADLAGVQHLGDGAPAEVGRGDDVLLATGVAGGHRLGRGHGDAFGHADELLRRGGLWRRVRAAEHLPRQTTTKHHEWKWRNIFKVPSVPLCSSQWLKVQCETS